MADGECEYYRVDERPTTSRTSGQDFATADLTLCPWCAHPNSGVTQDMANNAVVGMKLLVCGGDLADCEIGYNGEPMPNLPLPDMT